MSHFTSVKTKIRDLVCLVRAIDDLNYAYSQAEQHQAVHVRGYQGQKTDAAISIHVSKTYDVGVRLTADGTYEFVADWEYVFYKTGLTEEEFVKKLTQRYSYHKVMTEIKKRGFTLESQEETEDQTIHVRVRTWS